MIPFSRPLAGCRIGLSISESEESTDRGFPAWQVNRVTVQVAAAFYGQGASLVFGHDWREDGVMEAVHNFARQTQPPEPLPSFAASAARQPLLLNVLPWPEKSRLLNDDQQLLAETMSIEEAGLPAELLEIGHMVDANPEEGTPIYRYLRARGLTHFRNTLNARCDSRVCMGGRQTGWQGRYPGVVEEAYVASQAEHPFPLYLIGMLGGVTRQIIDAIEGHAMPDTFCHSNGLTELFLTPPAGIIERNPRTINDRAIDRNAVWETFRQIGDTTIALHNGLTDDENLELFHTPILDRAIELVLSGVSALRHDV